MDYPIVSIVIPIYNPPEISFKRCMESVLAQTYKELEIILVDDGSAPQFAAEIDGWSDRDTRIHIVHKENGGVSSARNLGVSLAKGKYISFVDADDCVTDNWLEKAVKIAEDNDADIIYGRVCMVDRTPDQVIENPDIHTLKYEEAELWKVQKMFLFNNGTPLPDLPYVDFGPCGKLFQTDIVKQVNFPINLPLAEDQVFNHAVLHKSTRVIVTNIPAYYYVFNNDSATHRSRSDAVEILRCAMEQIRTFLFDRADVLSAYYYCFITEIAVGIQISYFYEDCPRFTFLEKYKAVKMTFTNPTIQESVKNISLNIDVGLSKKIKLWLIKHGIYMPFVLVWSFKQWHRKTKRVL